MNAQVKINIGVQSRKRMNDEPFRPTYTWTESWNKVTDLDSYLDDTPVIAEEVYEYVEDQKNDFCEVTTHVGIRLDNVTHPATAAGVLPLPKGHWDMAISHEEFVSSSVFEDTLNGMIANLKQGARY